MEFVSAPRGVGGRNAERVERLQLAAGDRHLGADDIGELAPASLGFRNRAELGGAFGDRRLGQDRVVGAGHAGVEMDLRKSRFDKNADHVARLPHRVARRPRLPGIGAEVIAAEDEPRGIDARLARQALDKQPKGRRRHAGIAAVLVDLIAGRLDEDRPLVVAVARQDRAKGLVMGGAPRWDAERLAGAVARDDRV